MKNSITKDAKKQVVLNSGKLKIDTNILKQRKIN